MIINKTVIKGLENLDPDDSIISAIHDMIEYEGISQDVDNEPLAILDSNMLIGIVEESSTGDDFTIVFKMRGETKEEVRFIHENIIQEKFEDQVNDYYDRDQWVDSVNANGTDLGYDDWVDDIIEEGNYGDAFGTSNGSYEEYGEYIVLVVG